MDKFIELDKYLRYNKNEKIIIHFSEIEEMIGQKLCKSAYVYYAYWKTSGTHYLANLIEECGYKIFQVDLKKQILNLVKIGQYHKEDKISISKPKPMINAPVKNKKFPTSFKEEILLTVPISLTNLENDKNLMVKINKHNSEIVETLIEKDPQYQKKSRKVFDEHFKNDDFDEDVYFDIIKKIAVENSTRSSTKVCRMIARFIINPNNNFLKGLEEGDPKLVDKLKENLINNGERKEKSLPSKVCRYLNEWVFKGHAFTINDSVVRAVLPYYLSYYKIDKSYWYGKELDKLSYVSFFEIFNQLYEKVGNLNRHEIDHILWYSYKNDNIRMEIARAFTSVL